MAQRVGDVARTAAAGGGDAESAVQQLVIDVFRPAAGPVAAPVDRRVPRPLATGIFKKTISPKPLVRQAHRIDQIMSDPKGQVPATGHIGFDPHLTALFQLAGNFHTGWKFLIEPGTAGKLGRNLLQLIVTKPAARPGIATGQRMVISPIVKLDQRRSGGRLRQTPCFFVGPGDQLSDIQVFGPHQELEVAGIPSHVHVTGPPSLTSHIDKPSHGDGLTIAGETADREVANAGMVLWAAFGNEPVIAFAQGQADLAFEHKVVSQKRLLGRLLRQPTGIGQVQTAGQWLLGLFVHDGQAKFAARRGGGGGGNP